MRMTTFGRESEVNEFAKRAMQRFISDNRLDTYTDKDVEAGCLFAIRWGAFDRCILVFRLDENVEPVNFQDCLTTREGKI